jgi:hypothetical protein
MAANNIPIATKEGHAMLISIWTSSLTANTKSDGTGTIGTDMVKALTGTTEGTFVQKLRFFPAASTAATATTASVIRVYLSTVGSGSTTRTDTTCIGEISATSQSAANSTSGAMPLELPIGFIVPSGYYLHWSMHHAAAANTSWGCVPIASNY